MCGQGTTGFLISVVTSSYLVLNNERITALFSIMGATNPGMLKGKERYMLCLS